MTSILDERNAKPTNQFDAPVDLHFFDRDLAAPPGPRSTVTPIWSPLAVDIHTHAEEPRGTQGDDGYDDLQATMAAYFRAPYKHPPTIEETAAYYRERKVGAGIFPVDAERETGC